MATTTPNFGWPVPTSTDLVKDGATAIEGLGDAIDASLLDLKGGTSGQVLAKNSNTDMDFVWVAQDDSNAIQNAIVDAKGDLIGATAADTPARLAVGTNGQVLTADSTASTGLKWATPASPTTTFSGTLLDNSTFQTISNNTVTAITWSVETYDTDGFHDTSTNTSRITIPAGKAGYYMLGGEIGLDTNGTGNRIISIFKNGNEYKRLLLTPSNVEPTITINAPANLAVGDYVELRFFQNSGGSRNVYTNGADAFFYANYMGA